MSPTPFSSTDRVSSVTQSVPAGSPSKTPTFSPLYQQIKGLILNRLRLNEWKPGQAIPSEMELAKQFHLSQGTVRKAINELAAENLLLRQQGKGTFVATHAQTQVQFRFLKLVPDSGAPGSEGPAERDIIECRRVRASAEVARALALRTGEFVLQVRRVLSFGGTPAILEDIWLPAQPFKGLTAQRLALYPGPSYALFELDFNIHMVRAEEKIRAQPAVAGRDKLLKVKYGTPLLSVERIAYTYKDVPMELRRGYYRTDSHYYHNTLS